MSLPAPEKNKIFVSCISTVEKIKIIVSDITGREVLKMDVKSCNNLIEIDVSKFNKGFYVINLESNRATYQARFVKN